MNHCDSSAPAATPSGRTHYVLAFTVLFPLKPLQYTWLFHCQLTTQSMVNPHIMLLFIALVVKCRSGPYAHKVLKFLSGNWSIFLKYLTGTI